MPGVLAHLMHKSMELTRNGKRSFVECLDYDFIALSDDSALHQHISNSPTCGNSCSCYLTLFHNRVSSTTEPSAAFGSSTAVFALDRARKKLAP